MWKEAFELQEKCRFVKKSGARERQGRCRISYYYCNRSGLYVSQGKGIKQGKKKGSAKSNNCCTASITCEELSDGKVDVKVCSTHYGHDSDLQHLRLSRSEKFHIAEMLSQGMPRELVLDIVRASAGSNVERINLVTEKDVKNIEKAYGIQSITNYKDTQGVQDMFSNLTNWVSYIMQTENSPVLFFQEDGMPNTLSHDVTIIIFTKGQMEALQKYANLGIFFVSTIVLSNSHSSLQSQKFKPKNLYITTVMVVDDVNESFPVGFMVSNQDNDVKYDILFGSLKKRVPTMSAKSVVTDCREDIYTRWCTVFQELPNHYWSNRFIDSDWRENLMTIDDENLQVSIYDRLCPFLEPNDSNVLSSLEAYVSALQENPLTIKFTDHFVKIYIGSESYWAGCFGKLEVPVSAQRSMELFCNNLIELCEKKYWDKNFFVKTVQNLLKLATDKQCDRQSKLNRQIHEMSLHHDLGSAIKPEYVLKISEASWRVESLKDPKNIFSIVSQQIPECGEPTRCVLMCSKCNSCAHQMQCSCRVYTYDRTMCKHMHAVAMNYFPPVTVVKINVIDGETNATEETGKVKLTTRKNKVKKVESTIERTDLPTNSKGKVNENESTGVRGILPVIEEILCNKRKTKSLTEANKVTSSNDKVFERVGDNEKGKLKDDNTRRLRKRKSQEMSNNGDTNCKKASFPKIAVNRKRRTRISEKCSNTTTETDSEPVQRSTLRRAVKKPSKLNL